MTSPRAIAAAQLLALLATGIAIAHPGRLDANGCHYEKDDGKYHPDVTAPAKKSRENICHDAASPNYKKLRYFISYPDLAACLNSGGSAYRK